jgi:membrane protein YdbS with pleckstrin-like domain
MRTVLLAALVVALIIGHGIIFYLVSSHTAVSATVVSGVIVLLVVKHVGLLRALYARWRRRSARE